MVKRTRIIWVFYFEAADLVLEEEGQSAKVGVRVYAVAGSVLELRCCDFGVVEEAELEEGVGVGRGEAWFRDG